MRSVISFCSNATLETFASVWTILRRTILPRVLEDVKESLSHGMNWFFLHRSILHLRICGFVREKRSYGEGRSGYYQRGDLCKVRLKKIALRGGCCNCRWSGGTCNLSVSSVYKHDYRCARWRKIVASVVEIHERS
jgi:hypothetical protein